MRIAVAEGCWGHSRAACASHCPEMKRMRPAGLAGTVRMSAAQEKAAVPLVQREAPHC